MQILKIWTNGTIGRFSLLLLGVVLLGEVASGTPVEASGSAQSSSAPPASFAGLNSASSPGEITVLGTIRQVISNREAGGPAGVHILIDGPLGSFDASLGSNLPGDVLQALSNGVPVQITGVVRSANGKNFLQVRQLSVGGKQITIRNANGFLVHNPSWAGSSSSRARSGNGGVQ
jgi:hypothetical protein